MKTRKLFALSLTVALAGLATAANAASVFSDDFDNLTATALKTPPPGWDLVTGNVDHVRTGDYGITCAGGSNGCVDLDGTSSPTTTAIIGLSPPQLTLGAGSYKLSFDVSGNQRDAAQIDQYVWQIATGSSGTIKSGLGALAGSEGFRTITAFFDLGASEQLNVFFWGNAGDNVGILLDNVNISTVPLPAAAWLLLSGLGGLAAFARRRRSTPMGVAAA